MDMSLNKLKVGIVAGILPQAAVELKTRLIAEAQKLGRPVEVVMDWEPPRKDAPDPLFHLRDQKMLSLDASIRLQKEGVDLILLPASRSRNTWMNCRLKSRRRCLTGSLRSERN